MTAGKNDARLKLEEIFRLVEAGELAAAEQLCREALLHDGKDINVLGIFGAILLKKNELVEAEKILQSVTELEPAFAKPHEDLGLLYLNQNKPESAVRCFEKAAALDATQASAFRGLSTALQQCGRQEEAQVALKTYLALSPTDQSLAQARLMYAEGESQHADRRGRPKSRSHFRKPGRFFSSRSCPKSSRPRQDVRSTRAALESRYLHGWQGRS